MKPAFFAVLFLIFALALSACNLPTQGQQPNGDPNQLATAVAQTLQAQLTSQVPLPSDTAQAGVPTNTLLATATTQPTATTAPPTLALATSTSNCNAAQFVDDVTIEDGTLLQPNQAFLKTWRLRNSGSCSWTPAYSAVFFSGNAMSGPTSQALPGNVNPGQTVDISINFKAPATPGEYTAVYKLRDAGGVLFAQFYVKIKVTTGGEPDDQDFAVIHVTFNKTGTCGNIKATANISTNGPGTVKYHWKFSDGATAAAPAPLVFTAAGTLSVNYKWTVAAPGNYWIDIYIDEPNHQQFGRVKFHCP